jgi:hypothetical protein
MDSQMEGRAMGQAASRLPVTGPGFDPGSCEMCAGQSGTGTGLCRTHWHWDVCAGHGGTGTGLCRIQWHWDRFVPDKVALGQVCAGRSGTGTGFSLTTSTVPHQDRYRNAPFSLIFAFSC